MLFGNRTCSKSKFFICGVNVFGHAKIIYGNAVTKCPVQAIKEDRTALGSLFEDPSPCWWGGMVAAGAGARGSICTDLGAEGSKPHPHQDPKSAPPPKHHPPAGDRVFGPVSLRAHSHSDRDRLTVNDTTGPSLLEERCPIGGHSAPLPIVLQQCAAGLPAVDCWPQF